MTLSDLFTAISLVAITVATRVIFACRYLTGWDSILLARALEHFNILAHRPHPPGYIFSVWAAKFFAIFFEPNAAYIAVGIAATAITAILIWRIALRYVSPAMSFAISLLWCLSPLVWFWGSVAETYIISPLFVSAGILAAIRFDESDGKKALWSAVLGAIVGIASGFRQDLIILMGVPALFFVLINYRHGIRKTLFPFAAGFAGPFALWFGISSANCGGVREYLDIVHRQFTISVYEGRFRDPLFRFKLAGERIAVALVFAFGIAVVPFIAVVLAHPKRALRAAISNIRTPIGYMIVQIVFTTIFFLVVFMAKSGYILIFVPPTMILLSVAFKKYSAGRAATAIVIVLAILNGIATPLLPKGSFPRYYYSPESARQIYDRLFAQNTLANLRAYEEKIETITDVIIPENPPERTIVLIARARSYFSQRHAQFFLENYPIICLYYPGYKLYYNFQMVKEGTENRIVIGDDYDRVLLIEGAFKPERIDGGKILYQRRVVDVDITTIENQGMFAYGDFTIIRYTPPDSAETGVSP